MSDEETKTEPEKVAEQSPVCSSKARKTKVLEAEYEHTRKRLAREKIVPLVQFTVFIHGCDDKIHGGHPDACHLDFVSAGSSLVVEGGLQFAIAGTENLLAALKAKLQ